MTTTSDARKRLAEAQAGPHAGCVPGQCRAGDQWRTVSCSWRGGDVETLIWAAFEAAVRAAAPDDPTGHLPNCGYINVDHENCACPEYGARLRTGLREAITAALAAPPARGLACCQIAVDCLTEHATQHAEGALTEVEREQLAEATDTAFVRPEHAHPLVVAVERIKADAYAAGHTDGESSGYADWVGQLGEVLPDDLELMPSKVAAWLAAHSEHPGASTGLREALGALVGTFRAEADRRDPGGEWSGDLSHVAYRRAANSLQAELDESRRPEDREGVGTGAGEGATGQDTGTAWVTRSTDCPEAPAQAHPLAPQEALHRIVVSLEELHEDDGDGFCNECGCPAIECAYLVMLDLARAALSAQPVAPQPTEGGALTEAERTVRALAEQVDAAAEALTKWNGEDGSLVVDSVIRRLRGARLMAVHASGGDTERPEGRPYDPDHCTACGDFLPCGKSWLGEPRLGRLAAEVSGDTEAGDPS